MIVNKFFKIFAKNMLIIYIKDVKGPSFTFLKWAKADYKQGVELEVEGARVIFHFEPGPLVDHAEFSTNRIDFAMNCNMMVVIDRPEQFLIDGLNNKTKESEKQVADKIYSIYEKTVKELVLQGRWYLKLPSILDFILTGFDELFYSGSPLSFASVSWKQGGGQLKIFKLSSKPPEKGVNPIFAEDNLLTIEKWKDFGRYLLKKKEISPNITELIRIRSKLVWREKRIPTIETVALMEVVIRTKVSAVLSMQGVSNKKLKDVNDEAGFSILLNMLLPLILKK